MLVFVCVRVCVRACVQDLLKGGVRPSFIQTRTVIMGSQATTTALVCTVLNIKFFQNK